MWFLILIKFFLILQGQMTVVAGRIRNSPCRVLCVPYIVFFLGFLNFRSDWSRISFQKNIILRAK